MEGRIREGATGRVIALFADRQVGKQELVTMTDSDWSSHIHHIMDNWASQISILLNPTRERKNNPFINLRVESIGKAFADMLSKLSSVPSFRLQAQ